MVSFNAGVSLLNSQYTKATNGGTDYSRETWSLTAGMSYRFTQTLSGNISYTYTRGESEYSANGGYYNRDVISAGLSYTF